MIHETEWKQSLNQLVDFKHIWTCAGGKCFIAVASRTQELGYATLPLMRGAALEVKQEDTFKSDEAEAYAKVEAWLVLNGQPTTQEQAPHPILRQEDFDVDFPQHE